MLFFNHAGCACRTHPMTLQKFIKSKDFYQVVPLFPFSPKVGMEPSTEEKPGGLPFCSRAHLI